MAATNSNLEELLSTSARLAKLHPGLKVTSRIQKYWRRDFLNLQVILADSQEAPLLEDELPQGVESVVQVSEGQAEAGRGLLFQQVAFATSCFDSKAMYIWIFVDVDFGGKKSKVLNYPTT